MTLRSLFHWFTGFPSKHPFGLTFMVLAVALFAFHGPVFGAIGGATKAVGGAMASLVDSPSDYVENTLTEEADDDGKIDTTQEAEVVLRSEYPGQAACMSSKKIADTFSCAVTDVNTLASEHYRVDENGTITYVDVKAEREKASSEDGQAAVTPTDITSAQATKTVESMTPGAKVACSVKEDYYQCASTDLDSLESLVFEIDKTTGEATLTN